MARRASPRRGARRLAPRRLGSERDCDADPPQGGHSRVRAGASRARLPQPIRSSVSSGDRADHACCASRRESSRHPSLSLPISPGGRGSSRASTSRGRRRSRSCTTFVPKPIGATGCTDHGGGLRVHAPTRSSSTALPDDLNRTEVRSVRALDREDRSRSYCDPDSQVGAELFGSILPRHALRGRTCRGSGGIASTTRRPARAIGSGPFLVERWERGKQITLRRNPRYWGPHPAYLDRLVLRFGGRRRCAGRRVPERRVRRRCRISAELLRRLPARARPRTFAFPGTGWEHFEIRAGPGGHPALRNKLVRRALAFGIDRGPRREGDVRGHRPASYGSATASSTRLPSRYYRSNWGRYRYRPAEARRLLELRGLSARARRHLLPARGNDSRSASWLLVIPGGYRPRVVELVQAQLQPVGCRSGTGVCSATSVFDQILPSGAFDVALFAWNAGPDPGA